MVEIPNMDWISKLFQYSNQIAGNSWDAEDLAQDAYLKVMAANRRDPVRTLTNAYLYRVTLNTWKDKKKKRRVDTIPLDLVMDPPIQHSSFSTRELLELLADLLPPRMVVILLLMDVFDFTAKETAEMIASKEATVQVTLGRARKRLQQLGTKSGEEALDFEALVEAFRSCNPNAIYKAYLGLSHDGIQISQIRSANGRLYITFCDPEGNLFTVFS